MVDSRSPKQAHQILDCIGLYCPMPVVKTKQEVDKLAIGEILEEIEKTGEGMRFLILKEK